MIRKWTAIVLCALVPVALLTAPLVHLHADDHDAAVVHTHLSEHQAHNTRPGLSQLDHDHHARTVFLTALSGVSTSAFTFVTTLSDAPVVLAPQVRPAEAIEKRSHGHDPPICGVTSLRAPPAFLS